MLSAFTKINGIKVSSISSAHIFCTIIQKTGSKNFIEFNALMVYVHNMQI